MKNCSSVYFLCNIVLLFTSFVSYGSDRLPRIALKQNGIIKEISNDDVVFAINNRPIKIKKKILSYFPLLQELFNDLDSAKPIDITHLQQQNFFFEYFIKLINIITEIVARNEKDQSPITQFKNLTEVVNNEAPKQFYECLQMALIANYLNMQNPFFSVLVRHLKNMNVTNDDLTTLQNSKLRASEDILKLLINNCVIKNKKILERHYTKRKDPNNRVLSVAFDNNKTLISLLYKQTIFANKMVNYIEKRTTDNFSPKTMSMGEPAYTEANLGLKNKPLFAFSPDNNFFAIALKDRFKLFHTATLYEIPFIDKAESNQFCFANLPTPKCLAVCYKKSIAIYETDKTKNTGYSSNPFTLSHLVPVEEALSDWRNPSFSFDNKRFAAMSTDASSKTEAGEVLAIFNTDTWQARYIRSKKIFDYCFSFNNKWIATALDNGKQKKVVIQNDFDGKKSLKINPDEQTRIAFSPNSAFFTALINEGKTIVVYDTQHWNCIQVIDVNPVNKQFTTFSLSPDSNWLIVGVESHEQTPGYTLYDTTLWNKVLFIPSIDNNSKENTDYTDYIMPFCFNKQSSNVHLCTTFCQNSAYNYGIVWNIQKITAPLFTSEKYKNMSFTSKIGEIHNHNKKNKDANDAMIQSKSNLLGLPIRLLNKYNSDVKSRYLYGALGTALLLTSRFHPMSIPKALDVSIGALIWWSILDQLQRWYRY